MGDTKFKNFSAGSKILAITEFVYSCLTLLFSAHINQRMGWTDPLAVADNILFIISIIFALFIQLFAIALGLYNPSLRENYRSIFRRIVMAVVLGYFCFNLVLSFFGTGLVEDQIILISVVFCLAGFSLIRFLFFHFDYFQFGKTNILILGAGERASIIEKRMRRRVDRQRFNLHGFAIIENDSENEGIVNEEKFRIDKGKLLSFVLENNINEVVIACDERRNNLPIDELFTCKIRGISVIDILDFIERETGQVAVNLIYPSWVIYSNGFSSTHYLRSTMDRIFNTLLAMALFSITWPVMLLTALLIKTTDGIQAPIFYRQKRVGINGHIFEIMKFRSMRVDAEDNGPVWAKKNDGRITKIGGFLRKYRIDELPQIYNVLKGDMGFVGPRPERPEFVQDLNTKIPYYNQRHNVKPGITGWAILQYPYGDTEQAAMEKLQYDLYYVKHRSFLLDLHIFIRTMEIILFGRGR